MAVFHWKLSVFRRSDNANAVAKAAYRARCYLRDEKNDRAFDRSNGKADITFSEVICPPGVSPPPLTGQSRNEARSRLWSNCEKKAKEREDAILAREIVVALAKELSPARRHQLAREYVYEHIVVPFSVVVDLNGHRPPDPESGNHHFHAQFPAWVCGDSFTLGKKTRVLDQWHTGGPIIKSWREAWAEMTNRFLAEDGIVDALGNPVTISAEKLPDDMERNKHLGPFGWYMKKRIDAIDAENAEIEAELERRAEVRAEVRAEAEADRQQVMAGPQKAPVGGTVHVDIDDLGVMPIRQPIKAPIAGEVVTTAEIPAGLLHVNILQAGIVRDAVTVDTGLSPAEERAMVDREADAAEERRAKHRRKSAKTVTDWADRVPVSVTIVDEEAETESANKKTEPGKGVDTIRASEHQMQIERDRESADESTGKKSRARKGAKTLDVAVTETTSTAPAAKPGARRAVHVPGRKAPIDINLTATSKAVLAAVRNRPSSPKGKKGVSAEAAVDMINRTRAGKKKRSRRGKGEPEPMFGPEGWTPNAPSAGGAKKGSAKSRRGGGTGRGG